MNSKCRYVMLFALACFAAGCRHLPSESGNPDMLQIRLSHSDKGPEVYFCDSLFSWERLTEWLVGLKEHHAVKMGTVVVGVMCSETARPADLNRLLALLSSAGYRHVDLLAAETADNTQHCLRLHVQCAPTSSPKSPFIIADGKWGFRPLHGQEDLSNDVVRAFVMTEDSQLFKTPRVPRGIAKNKADEYIEGYRLGWHDVGSRSKWVLYSDGELNYGYMPRCFDTSGKGDIFMRGYTDGCDRAEKDLKRYKDQIERQIKRDQNK